MNRLMILGSMDEFVSLVQKAKARGITVIVCDGYPDGPAKLYADRAYDVDIRLVDQVAQICREERVDGIIASFSDILFEYLVQIAAKAGLKTYCTPKQAEFLRSKQKMREMFQELGIPCAKNHVLTSDFKDPEIADLSFPVVMKPLNGYGSRGVFVVNTVAEIHERFEETSRYSIGTDRIMAEEYNSGYEFNMTNWILDKEVYTLSIADREKAPLQAAGDIPPICRLVYPSRMTDLVYEEARKIVRKVASYVGITTGPLSMQFFYQPEKGIQVCECAGRFFGYEHELLSYSSGFFIEDLLLDYVYDETAMRKRVQNHSFHLPRIIGGLYFHGRECIVGSTKAAEELMRQVQPLEYTLYYKNGEPISHDTGAKPYVIRLDIAADTYEELDQKSRRILEQMVITDGEGENLIYPAAIPVYPSACHTRI